MALISVRPNDDWALFLERKGSFMFFGGLMRDV